MWVPRLAITAGEPAGIGPDIVVRAAQRQWHAQLVAIADPALLMQRARQLDLPLQLLPFDTGEAGAAPAPQRPGTLYCQRVALARPAVAGQLDAANAPYVLATLQRAVAGCTGGCYQGMVTAPVQKSIINEAGISFSGHTEFLAAAITAPLLHDTLRILHHDLRGKFAIAQPRIAVLGLNPHAGEGGHLGREEIDVIIPALSQLRAEGMHLLGPLPADTAFNPRVLDAVDAVFALYHDQGLPVLKYAGFGEAVNITLGLPIIRTSVDHGTALDLAGSGRADAGSLEAALRLAIELATVYSPAREP